MAAITDSISFSTQIVHIGSGASIAPGAFSASADVSTALAGTGNLARYPLADVSLMIVPTASINSTSTAIYLYRRDLNIDSTNDETLPGTSNRPHLVGVFTAPAATATSGPGSVYMLCNNVDISSGDCEFYIESAITPNIPAGWTLKVTPKTDAFA